MDDDGETAELLDACMFRWEKVLNHACANEQLAWWMENHLNSIQFSDLQEELFYFYTRHFSDRSFVRKRYEDLDKSIRLTLSLLESIEQQRNIIPERSNLNVHFKTPTDDYAKMFEQMEADKIISTRGTKADAFLYGELVFDVNSAYFHNHGGYEFAKQFYADAYKAAVQIVGGERFVLSAVMHADERNRAMSEALRQDVYHYHLHVVYVPVVEKHILWTKRCKDPALDGNGDPLLTAKGKPVLRKSYSVLQDNFFNFMKASGYTDLERGERGSSEEHLTVIQFKVEKEQERLDALDAKIEKRESVLARTEKKLDAAKGSMMAIQDIDQIGSRTFTGNISMSPQEADRLKALAKEGISSRVTIADLKEKLKTVTHSEEIWRSRYEKLKEQTKDFLAAMERAAKSDGVHPADASHRIGAQRTCSCAEQGQENGSEIIVQWADRGSALSTPDLFPDFEQWGTS